MGKSLKGIFAGVLAAVLVLNNAVYVSAESALVSVAEEIAADDVVTETAERENETELVEKVSETEAGTAEDETAIKMTEHENETEKDETKTHDVEMSTENDVASSTEETETAAEILSTEETEEIVNQETTDTQVGETDSATGITWAYLDGELSVSYNGTIPQCEQYPWQNYNGTDYIKMVETLVLNEGITGFDHSLIWKMENLKQIRIPASCVEIRMLTWGFGFTYDLQDIYVADGNEVYSSIDGVLFDAKKETLMFYPLGKTTQIYTVPDSCVTINWLCSNQLQTVILAKNTRAITNCIGGMNLKTVKLSDSLSDIGGFVFEADELVINESNPKFSYDNHVLFDKNKTKLYQMMRAFSQTEYTVPDTVTWIDLAAFCDQNIKLNILSPEVSFEGNPFGLSTSEKGTIYVPTAEVKSKIESALSAVNVTEVIVSIDPNLDDTTDDEAGDDVHVDAETGIKWKFTDGTLDVYYDGDLSKIDAFYPWFDFDGDSVDYYKEVVNIVFHEGITKVHSSLVSDMENLEQVSFPASFLGDEYGEDDYGMFFLMNDKLNQINVSAGNTKYASIDGVLFNKDTTKLIYYPAGKTAQTYTVPDSCKTIDYLYSDQLQKVILGKNTVSITGEVGGINLKTVTVSDSLAEISSTAFEADELIISASNPNFFYENHVLFDKNKTKLYQMMRAFSEPEYTVPDTVTWIGESAFYRKDKPLKLNILSPDVSFESNPFGYSAQATGTIYVPNLSVKNEIKNALSAVKVTGVTVSIDPNLDYITGEEPGDDASFDVETGIYWKLTNGTLHVYYTGDLSAIGETDYPWCDYGEQVVTLILHQGITKVDSSMVGYMENLESITFPASFIGNTYEDDDYGTFFVMNDKLKEILVSEENVKYMSIDGVLFNKNASKLIFYPYAKGNTSYTVPESCTSILSIYSENLKELNLGTHLETIEQAYGAGGPNLQKLSVPATLKLSAFPMFDTSKDTIIKIDASNPYILLKDDVIYNKNKTVVNQLLASYKKEELTLPDTVVEIGEDAFAYTQTPLKVITLPQSVRKIGNFAFTSVKNITRVNLLSEDVTFGGNPFFISAVSTSKYAAFYVPTVNARKKVLAALERVKATNVSVYVDENLLGGGIPFSEEEEDTLSGNACGKILVTFGKSSMAYTGSTIEPKVTVKYSYRPYDEDGNLGKAKTIKLLPNVDYSVTCQNNIECGEGIVVITGLGEYDGIIEKPFTITQKKANKLTIEPIADLAYEGVDLAETIKESVLVKDGVLTVSKDDYDVIIGGSTSQPGTVKVSISLTKNSNYFGDTSKKFVNVKIVDAQGKINASKVTLSVDTKKTYTYNGKAQKPKVTVTMDGKKLSSKNYKLVYKNNVHAGTGTVYAVGKNEFYGKSAEYTFTIAPKDYKKVKISKLSKIQLMNTLDNMHPIVKDGSKTLREGEDYEVSFDSVADMNLLGYKFKKVKVYVTMISSDYTKGTISTELMVYPKKLGNNIYTTIEVEDDYYLEGMPCEPMVDVYYGGKLLWEDEDYKITYKNNTKPGKGKVIIEGIGNYSGKVTKTFQILK